MDKYLISNKQSTLPMHSFTPEDLLQYLYKETSPEKSAAITAALECDWSLREKFEVLSDSFTKLETIKFSPRQNTINNILSYAEKAVEELSHQA
jgi:hypothetical protein